MGKLFLLLYVIIAPVLAGILVTVALAVGGLDDILVWTAIAGFVIAIPVSIPIASALNRQFRS